MRLYAIGDLHLSFGEGVEKPMDIFGPLWEGHAEKLRTNWEAIIQPEDTVIICGDISWGLKLEEAKADLDWVHELPGKKIFFKGNHDLWWQSIGKLNKLYDDGAMNFMQCNCYMLDEKTAVCGARGWVCPGSDGFSEHDRKIYQREVARLKMSLDDAKKQGAEKIIGVLHFPPTNDKHQASGFTQLMSEYGVKTCVYGHLHGRDAFKNGIKSVYNGVQYRLVSLDYLDARPEEVII